MKKIMILVLVFTFLACISITSSKLVIANTFYEKNNMIHEINEDNASEVLDNITGEITISIFLDYKYPKGLLKDKDNASQINKYKFFHIENNEKYSQKLNLDIEEVFYSSYAPLIVYYTHATSIDVYEVITMISQKKYVLSVSVQEINQQTLTGFPGDLCYYDPSGDLICDPPPPPPPPVDHRNIDEDNFPNGTSYSGEGVKIGILDKGQFKSDHDNFDDIYTKIVIDDPQNTNDYSSGGVANLHPTITASILGGKYGIANKSKLYFADSDSVFGEYREIQELLNYGVDVINISLSYQCQGNSYEHPVAFFINYLVSYKLTIIVAASGNNLNKVGLDGRVCQVASYANVIAVGSITTGGYPSAFSSYQGYDYENFGAVEYPLMITAVGTQRYVGGINAWVNGTSFSTPAVTGTIALLLEKYENLTAFNAMTILAVTSDISVAKDHLYTTPVTMLNPDGTTAEGVAPIMFMNYYNPDVGFYDRYGAGSLDIEAALNYDGPVISDNLPTLFANESFQAESVSLNSDDELVVALAWERVATRNPDDSFNQSPIVNLGIQIKDSSGIIVAETTVVDNNIEMIRFTPTTSGTYTIEIIAYEDATSISNYSYSYVIY